MRARLVSALVAASLPAISTAPRSLSAIPSAATAGGQAGRQAPALTAAAPFERALAGGESHAYRVERPAAAPWLLAVEQQGIDVVVVVTDVGGRTLAAGDHPLDREGVETLLGPEAAGVYRVEVRAEETAVGAGGYAIRLEELPAATAEDRLALEAVRALSEGGRLLLESLDPVSAAGPDAARQATVRYLLAAKRWQALGRRREEADAVHAAAVLTRRGQEPWPALELYRRALALWEAIPDPGRTAAALNDVGLVHWRLGELPEARDAFERALAINRSLGRRYPEAEVLHNQCLIAHSRGELAAALDCYPRAYELFRELGEAEQEAVALNNIGFAWYGRGEPQKAVDHYRRALEIRRRIGDRAGEAQSLNNIAVVHRNLGETQEALTAYRQAREILGPLGDRRQEASVLHNIGVAYLDLGEGERARAFLERALELRREVEDRRGEATTLNNLGRLAFREGEPARALEAHRRALELTEGASDRRGEAITRVHIAELHAAAGDPGAALGELGPALAILGEVGDRYYEARARHEIGEALLASSQPEEAAASLGRALELRRALGDRTGEAATLAALARTGRALGDLEQALADAEAAVAVVESLRTRLASPQLRASFFGSRIQPYELLIDLMIDRHAADPGAGWERRALEVSERARARSLLDLLAESGAEIRRGVDPVLAERRRALERRLDAKATRRLDLLGRHPDSPEARALGLEIPSVLAELEDVEAEIRRRNPAYAALTRPPPSTAQEIQALLDPGTVLLEVALGERRSFLWRVSVDAVAVFELPARADVEAAARRVHELLSAPNPRGAAPRREAVAELSRLVLGPLRDRPAGGRLAVVADGALHLVPFAALPWPDASAASSAAAEPEPLVMRHEVVHLPSASTLAAQRHRFAGRRPAPRRAAVLADPVFDARDPRVANGSGAAGASTTVAFDRLPFTRREALAIAALAPEGEVLTALDFAAGRALVAGGRLGEHRAVHFATHGVIDAAQPALSGLVLSLVDERGRPQEGFLRLQDVYDLELAAELVVLSGCRTALGREIRGEGLWGLGRGFMYAGARRVVASLWWVQDRATTELMTHFYRAMWEQGLPPAAALRAAQLSMRSDRRFRDPFYWAAFVHQGDWR